MDNFEYGITSEQCYLRKTGTKPPELLTSKGWEPRDTDYAYRDWHESREVTAEEVRREEEWLAAAGTGEVA